MIIWILISFSFSVHLFLHRPRTQNSRIIGQYTHNLLGLKTLSFSVLLFIHKNMDKRSPNWVRHAKCTWSSSRWQGFRLFVKMWAIQQRSSLIRKCAVVVAALVAVDVVVVAKCCRYSWNKCTAVQNCAKPHLARVGALQSAGNDCSHFPGQWITDK